MRPDPAEIRAVLDYDPQSGELRWKRTALRDAAWNGRWAGKVAGTIAANGYRVVKLHWVSYGAHVLAHVIMRGEWPAADIDHRDGDPANNRWRNLRPGTRAQNMQNSGVHANNTSGFKGVHWHAQNRRWWARIRHNGKRISLGTFATREEAAEAYAEAATRLHGAFARAK